MSALRNTIFGLLCASLLAGCTAAVPPLSADNTAIIPGSTTADQNQEEATKTVLTEAARITVDHGYQYFRIVNSQGASIYLPRARPLIRPGSDVTIRVFQGGDVLAGGPGLWDANKLLENGIPDDAATAAAQPTYIPPAPSAARGSVPRCTAYGCVW